MSTSEFDPSAVFTNLVSSHKNGQGIGLYSVCSANPHVLFACMQQALADDAPLLIESTSNQVNQYGGYTGMKPADFAAFVRQIAHRAGFPLQKIILGADHAGPHPWAKEDSSVAMNEAITLIQDCVRAGYRKIHLDASMRLGGDDPFRPPDPEIIAARTAILSHAAEDAADELKPLYVIGTEVPPPGGAQAGHHLSTVTKVEDAWQTIELTRRAFHQLNLEEAWQRVFAIVVQPGVEFGNDYVLDYDPTQAAPLSAFIETQPQLIYEAHSTDYQMPENLRRMVHDHFAVLKVGPALTFSLREAAYALAQIEAECLPDEECSHLSQIMETAMRSNPAYWSAYYSGDDRQVSLDLKYSFSDRIRYYWPVPEVERALNRLISNLSVYPPPLTLLSQYLPTQYWGVRAGRIKNTPLDLIHDKIREVVRHYSFACTLASS